MSMLGSAGAGLAQQQQGQNIWSALSQGVEKGFASRDAAIRESREAGRFKTEQAKAEREAAASKRMDPLIEALMQRMNLGGQPTPQPQMTGVPGGTPAPPMPPVQSQPLPSPGGAGQGAPPQAAIEALIAEPWRAGEFDAMFGPGLAQIYLGR